MNKVSLLFLLSCFFVGCSSNTTDNSKDQNNIVINFIEDVNTLETDTNKNPITAFKNLANDIAHKKIVLTKDNIKEVLNETKNYSSCIIVVANHTIIKINSTEYCQQSGSWETCMPLVTGYIKKGKLNYKSDFMNNVIGIPDDQKRTAYFFHNFEKKSNQKPYSFKQSPYSDYYKNGEIGATGHGFEKFNRYIVSVKNGLDLMEGANLKSNKLVTIPFGTEVWLKYKTDLERTEFDDNNGIKDSSEETIQNNNGVQTEEYDGKWINIIGNFYLPTDEVEPTYLEGYIFDIPMFGYLEIKPDSIKKPGVWTYYYDSGIIEREEFHNGGIKKEIKYDTNGNITEISENNQAKLLTGYTPFLYDFYYKSIVMTFHKNGNIKTITKGENFDVYFQITFDENRNLIKNRSGSDNANNHYKMILSKDIRDFHFYKSEQVFKEINNNILQKNAEEKIEINRTEIVDSDTSGWESPKNLFLIDDFYSSIIIRAEARYNRPDGLNEEEKNWIKNTDTLQWWILPIEGIAKKVNVTKNFIYTTKLCGDYGNFYATELDCDPNDISLACLGNPPESWFKKAPKCIISKDEAIQLITANLPADFQSIDNKFIITESTVGWDGYVNWCCPKKDNPIHETVDEMSIVEYRIPVIVSAQSKITIGAVKAHTFGGEGSMKPSLKRDIDGDGILEIFWTGCQNYWTHDDKKFVSNIGDCCGC